MVRGKKPKNYDPLHPMDRILWDAVRATTKAMHKTDDAAPRSIENQQEFIQALGQEVVRQSPLSPKVNEHKSKLQEKPIHPFDPPTHRKIAKGRLQIEARVDLHGLIQSEAYSLLLHFIQSAHFRGLKHVLVITGKGSSLGSDGVLRQSVPHWFSTPPFRSFVSAFEDAARHHGGGGALYVRLRRTHIGISS